MRHAQYCLTQHPGISSNITNATNFSTPTHATHVSTPRILLKSAHHPRYPGWHETHAGMSPTLAL